MKIKFVFEQIKCGNIKQSLLHWTGRLELLTAECEVVGSIPVAGPILRVLEQLRNKGTAFAMQKARPLRGSHNHVKWRYCLR